MLKRILTVTTALFALGGAAYAADLPSRSAPPVYVPPPPIFTWTGVYLGGQIGYQWGKSSTGLTAAGGTLGEPGYSPNGVIGGAHIGYNWQVAQFVLGLEGDVDGAGYRGSAVDAGTGLLFTTRETVEGSVRGRIGYAWDRVLIYGTGGVAFASIRNGYTNQITGASDTFTTGRVGWTAGGGLEYALTNNWSVRAEYRYTDFGSYSQFLANSTVGTFSARKHETDNAVRVGFSYKFDTLAAPPPIVAKY